MGKISRRGFLRAARNTLIGGTLAGLGLWKYSEFEAGWFKISQHTVTLKKLPEDFQGLRIAHISDLHFSSEITPERFIEVVEMVNRQSPDVIAITGDFIDRRTNRSRIGEYVEQLAQLSAPLGVFGVLGNHDYWQDPDLVRTILADSGIAELSNRAVALMNKGSSVYICGLDDHWEKKDDLPALLADFPEGETAVLLVHEPDYADHSAATRRFDLQLSGHSHGGQVYLPVFGPPVTPMYGQKYPRGLYQVEEMLLHTTSGIGVIPPFVRLNCRPEVALIELTA